jgi:mono/diheme cytochrome c family protein
MKIYGLPKRAVDASRLLLVAALAVPVSALGQQLAGNPSSGHQTATTVCASCHQVVGGTSGLGPPNFVDIANMPSTTALSLKVFLRSSHKEMPNLIISESDTDDVIAYILGLKQPVATIKRNRSSVPTLSPTG